MSSFLWTCPFCNRHATIATWSDVDAHTLEVGEKSKHGKHSLAATVITCPNPNCKEFTVEVMLLQNDDLVRHWRLIPSSDAKVFPDHIPQAIREDYEEACAIRDLSPKASAAVARRCLQGMVRDFHSVSKHSLAQEIEAIRDLVDPVTWKAIDAVRTVGNIGAHMEKDVNLIVEVESGEALALTRLIEILMKDWYINRHEREQQLLQVVSIGEQKKAQRRAKSDIAPTEEAGQGD